MSLRIFGAGVARVRPCPACEQQIKADATFCPSCYMVFRPEGAAALREFLQGARVPADVYLLRKMHTEDPNAGPVTRAAAEATDTPQRPRPETQPTAPSEVPRPQPSPSTPASAPPATGQAAGHVPRRSAGEERLKPRDGTNGGTPSKLRNGVEGFLGFSAPWPPPARSAEEVPDLFAWMLEKDPILPNHLARLQEIHAAVFRNAPVARLGYEQHLLLQVTEDLWLYTTEDSLGFHLAQLAAAYRRAADAYRIAESEGSTTVNHALWQMASLASRLRLEAWVYHVRHGESPQLPSNRQRELPLKFPGH